MTKGKAIAAVVIAAALVISFVWGGGYARPSGRPSASDAAVSGQADPGAGDRLEADSDGDSGGGGGEAAGREDGRGAGQDGTDGDKPGEGGTQAADASKTGGEAGGSASGSGSSPDSPGTGAGVGTLAPQKGSADYSRGQGMELNPKTGKDRYQTDSVKEGMPVPVEPQDAVITDKKMSATLSVRCDTLLDNTDSLDPEKAELVPKDGVILEARKVTFYEGESVFHLLKREMKKNKIHLEFVNTPIYNSAYIEGISNLYEFDCGELSGWMYRVNGWFPNYGSSRYQLKDGDVVEWVYTCDQGKDVGGYVPDGER